MYKCFTVQPSLAGRVALVELLPLSLAEISANDGVARLELNALMFKGAYPALYEPRRRSASLQGIQPSDPHSAYLSTYIDRDVCQVLGVRDLASFKRFVLMCAAR